MRTIFTPEELEELRKYDALVDASPMTHQDYTLSAFVDSLLFPDMQREKRREAAHRRYEKRKDYVSAYGKEYRAAHKEREAARKKAWYERNRERVLAQQREHRKSKAGG